MNKTVVGKFITKDQRSEHSNDVKKTHFFIGNYQHPEVPAKVQIGTEKVSEPNDVKKTMRESHFQLGKYKQVTETESKSRYKKLEFPLGTVKSSSTAEISKHKYKFGNLSEKMTTSSQAINCTKGDCAKVALNSNFSKSHHFVYGTDKPRNTTSAQNDFKVKTKSEVQVHEAENLKKDLQRSHFDLGKIEACYQTTSQSQFKPVKSLVEIKKMNLTQEHYRLGTDRPDYSTVSQHFYKENSQSTQAFNTDRLVDLRKSHILIGNSKPEYSLSSNELNQKNPCEKNENFQLASAEALRTTNFVLGSCNKPCKTTYSSVYASNINEKSEVPDKFSEKKSSIVLGSVNTEKVSTNHSDFKKLEVSAQNPSKNGDSLMKHNYDLGKDKSSYKLSNQVYGKFQEKIEKNEKVNLDLNSTHFVLGSSQSEYLSSNRNDFRNREARDIASEIGKVKEFQFHESNKRHWETEQKNRFSWIKPVPDHEFKFSFK